MNTLFRWTVVTLCLICSSHLSAQTGPLPGDDDFQQQASQRRNQNNLSIVQVVKIFGASGDAENLFKSLELTQDQLLAIGHLERRYANDIREIEKTEFNHLQFGDHAEQIRTKKTERGRQLRDEVNEVLLPHQLAELGKLDITKVGAARLLTDSLVSDVLELTDKQKSRIKERSDKLAAKIAELVHESRQEALDIINEELDESQIEKLYEIYDKDQLVRQISTSSVDTLYSQYLFTRPENQDTRYSPLLYIKITELVQGEDQK